MNYQTTDTFTILFKKQSICLLISLFVVLPIFSQTETENQFTTQIQLNKTIGSKTALELDVYQKSRSGTEETNPFYENSQESIMLWFHYFLNKKWKLSGMCGFIYNDDVPEINQTKLPEFRFSLQGTYYLFNSKELTLSSRSRLEDRILSDTDTNTIEIVYRFREMIKVVHPLTNIKLGKGTLFAIASEELFFKTSSEILGDELFDRNQLSLGLGYSFTDNFHVEINYINEYIPRTEVDKIHNIITAKFVLNDIISVLKKKFGTIPAY